MSTHAANDPLANEQPVLDLAMPVARIRGEPLAQMPEDLYIPPEALSVFLDAFEGPLDLLLYLIRRHSSTSSTSHGGLPPYMEYVEMMRLDTARARRRLPADGRAPDRDQVAHAASTATPGRERARDPRAELVRRLSNTSE